jgi:hypothetical protein
MREPAERVVGYSMMSDIGPMGVVLSAVDESMERVVVAVGTIEEGEQMQMAMQSVGEMVDAVGSDVVAGVAAVVAVGVVVEVVVDKSSSVMVISDLDMVEEGEVKRFDMIKDGRQTLYRGCRDMEDDYCDLWSVIP